MTETINYIEGTKELYMITDDGRVFSNITNKFLKLNRANKQGYHSVTLCVDGNKNLKLVHRLVAESFLPNLYDKPCVNHKDGINTNNNVLNLEWVTYSENTIHAYKNKLINLPRGKDCHLYGKTPHNKGNDSRITKMCVACNKEYKTYNNSSTLCSSDCRNKSNISRLREYQIKLKQ